MIAFAFYVPSVETALSGAGWQANGSQSVEVRNLLQKHFGGQASSAIEVVIVAIQQVSSPAIQTTIARVVTMLHADSRIGIVVLPVPGISISKDGRTAIVLGGASADPNTMVRAADALKGPLAALGTSGTTVTATGASVLWSDFNTAIRTAMLRSELFS